MYEIKDVAQDLMEAAKRRRTLLIITPILFVLAALVALYFIEPKYQSSTTILVQNDETLNPLVLYEIAVTTPEQDQIESLNEIIYSRSTMEVLIDSLKLDSEVTNEQEKQILIENISKNIGTQLKASDAFEISYFDTNPVRAKEGAELLTSHFINTKLRMEARKHKETVDFFSSKLIDLEGIVNAQRNQTVSTTSSLMEDLPSNSDALQDRLQEINAQLDALEWRLVQEEDKLESITLFQSEENTNMAISHLYKLPLSEMQFGEELILLLNEYDNLRQQFTESYPRLRTLSTQIEQVAVRIPPTITSNLKRLNSQKQELTSQKRSVVGDIQQFFVATQRATSQETDFSIYEGLQADMKVKLEQAKMARDIGMQDADKFLVLDAAVIADEPVSPNKLLILGVGLFLGLIMGIIASAFAEVMDTTLRDETELPFDKPIIAYISNS